jgi:curli biogenesis system outer membrane secretion channel CsgG
LALIQSTSGAQPTPKATQPASISTPSTPAQSKQDEETNSTELLKVKRIFVDSFGDDPISREMQSLVVSALAQAKRFKVTENREKADAILKGVALETTSQELHSSGESTAVRGAATSDSSSHTETINNARLAIRLVNSDGDVIWTSTQESKGAKYKGSSADAADKCVKQLLHDVEKLERAANPQRTAAPTSPEHH